jgi:HSP20 family protein
MRLVRYTYPTATRSLAPRNGLQSPWSGLESEIDRLFESVLGEVAAPTADRFPVDLFEDQDHLYVRAELPGVERSEINVEVVEDYLNITAARKNVVNGKEESFSLSRSVTVPESVQADKVTAQYQDGVLTVTLPKREESKPRKVAVAVS